MRGGIVVLTALCTLVVGCPGPETRQCSWGVVCPPDQVCHDPTEQCVLPGQIMECEGELEGASCTFPGSDSAALCHEGLCVLSEHFCGDGVVDSEEACDDGNNESGDGCSANCLSDETCGNAYVDLELDEECDCGDLSTEVPARCSGPNADDIPNRCRTDCRMPRCGDGTLDSTEICDEGEENSEEPDAACRSDCTPRRCGDGVADGVVYEPCDGDDLRQDNCVSRGFDAGGFLSCAASCQFDETCCNHRLLGICALPDGLQLPSAFTDCEVDSGSGNPVLRFGTVMYGQSETRVVAVRGEGTCGQLVTIQSISLQAQSGDADRFTISTFRMDTDGTTRIPLGLPLSLDPDDAEDMLFFEVQYDALADTFPIGVVLLLNSSDPGETEVLLDGSMQGCPPNWWDVNHNMEDGCEYHCVFQSTLEYCTASGDIPMDENCSGFVDEEDAQGCTVFFRDYDNDTYGAVGDYRCLCAPEGEYRATVGLDCNDNDYNIKPGVQERCVTTYDDNCDGTDNDPNSQGCVTYFRDEDGDGFGVTGDSLCLCYSSGFYDTTTSGDCDDDPAACGAACNPSKAESCATTADDNCNGAPNELNALNCTTYYRDFDMDGYGHQTLSQCWCYPQDLYTAVQPTDCDDTVATINPDATEICDYIDNNCADGTDEGFNLQTDSDHCGSCNHACVNPHGTTSCVGGQCAPICSAGWGSCDGNKENGCETDLSMAIYCGTCSDHPDCPTGFFCNIGTCTKKYTNGVACAGDVQCQTGLCRDGVCCDTSCGGTTPDCQACNLAVSIGTCTPRSAGVDPENACTVSAQSTCGLNGSCDGAGACALYSAGTVCQVKTCSLGIEYPQDICDGSGNCPDSGFVPCGAYTCNDTATACRTSCTQPSHCAPGYICTASNQCIPE